MLAGQGQRVYILRPTEELDSYGDPVRLVWDASRFTERPIRRGTLRLGPTEATEQGGRALQADEAELLVVGRVPDIGTHDRIGLDPSRVYRLEGVPVTRRSLASGTLTAVPLKRTVLT